MGLPGSVRASSSLSVGSGPTQGLSLSRPQMASVIWGLRPTYQAQCTAGCISPLPFLPHFSLCPKSGCPTHPKPTLASHECPCPCPANLRSSGDKLTLLPPVSGPLARVGLMPDICCVRRKPVCFVLLSNEVPFPSKSEKNPFPGGPRMANH